MINPLHVQSIWYKQRIINHIQFLYMNEYLLNLQSKKVFVESFNNQIKASRESV